MRFGWMRAKESEVTEVRRMSEWAIVMVASMIRWWAREVIEKLGEVDEVRDGGRPGGRPSRGAEG